MSARLSAFARSMDSPLDDFHGMARLASLEALL
jgi:hypothetical protein